MRNGDFHRLGCRVGARLSISENLHCRAGFLFRFQHGRFFGFSDPLSNFGGAPGFLVPKPAAFRFGGPFPLGGGGGGGGGPDSGFKAGSSPRGADPPFTGGVAGGALGGLDSGFACEGGHFRFRDGFSVPGSALGFSGGGKGGLSLQDKLPNLGGGLVGPGKLDEARDFYDGRALGLGGGLHSGDHKRGTRNPQIVRGFLLTTPAWGLPTNSGLGGAGDVFRFSGWGAGR